MKIIFFLEPIRSESIAELDEGEKATATSSLLTEIEWLLLKIGEKVFLFLAFRVLHSSPDSRESARRPVPDFKSE